MASIRDYMYDTALLEETVAYLANHHGLAVSVRDSEGRQLLQHGSSPPDGTSRLYPFRFASDIG
ncbi:MAG TPA: HD-GYP domain-containing protein, partial [Desulfurivibrionaceae bacterium]|nr:HD-GYP domain-containing protein [Desulfurivibrionaceae bacterium]